MLFGLRLLYKRLLTQVLENNMAHHVDIDSIHQNIFLLLNICYASKTFARNHDLFSDESEETVGAGYYFGWLSFTLSAKLIDIAIKTRVLLDAIGAEETRYREDGSEYPVNTRDLDDEICNRFYIGYFLEGDGRVNLRESCNRIIHALEIQPTAERGDDAHALDEEAYGDREWRYWSGDLEFYGVKGRRKWGYMLHVSEFCLALADFITDLEHNVDLQSLHTGNRYF